MLIGIDINEVREFVSELEKGSTNPTVFLIGNITNDNKMKLIGNVITPEGAVDMKAMQENASKIVLMGLRGIKNIYSPSKKLAVDIAEVKEDILNLIPFQALYEVAGAIIKQNFDMGAVTKN